jgi:hypothetical protein
MELPDSLFPRRFEAGAIAIARYAASKTISAATLAHQWRKRTRK